VARARRPSEKNTRIVELASTLLTTWLLVTIRPSASIRKPDPVDPPVAIMTVPGRVRLATSTVSTSAGAGGTGSRDPVADGSLVGSVVGASLLAVLAGVGGGSAR
jgi:hypothetical protein